MVNDALELMAEDRKDYESWLFALKTVIDAIDAKEGDSTIDGTIRKGNTSAYAVIQAANNVETTD